MSLSTASFKLFLINGFFALPSDLDLSQELLTTQAHCTLLDSFMADPLATSAPMYPPPSVEQLLLSGELKLYTQYVSCTTTSPVKQYQVILPFSEYIPLASGASPHPTSQPHIAIQDIYATLLDNQLIYYNVSLVATL